MTDKRPLDLTKYEGHTPGPWNRARWAWVIEDRNHTHVANAAAKGIELHSEVDANAAMIADAPAILSELKDARETIKAQHEALDRLAGEVAACWGMSPVSLRDVLGNTNYTVVEDRIREARTALALAARWTEGA